jgi:hypothetical protein
VYDGSELSGVAIGGRSTAVEGMCALGVDRFLAIFELECSRSVISFLSYQSARGVFYSSDPATKDIGRDINVFPDTFLLQHI